MINNNQEINYQQKLNQNFLVEQFKKDIEILKYIYIEINKIIENKDFNNIDIKKILNILFNSEIQHEFNVDYYNKLIEIDMKDLYTQSEISNIIFYFKLQLENRINNTIINLIKNYKDKNQNKDIKEFIKCLLDFINNNNINNQFIEDINVSLSNQNELNNDDYFIILNSLQSLFSIQIKEFQKKTLDLILNYENIAFYQSLLQYNLYIQYDFNKVIKKNQKFLKFKESKRGPEQTQKEKQRLISNFFRCLFAHLNKYYPSLILYNLIENNSFTFCYDVYLEDIQNKNYINLKIKEMNLITDLLFPKNINPIIQQRKNNIKTIDDLKLLKQELYKIKLQDGYVDNESIQYAIKCSLNSEQFFFEDKTLYENIKRLQNIKDKIKIYIIEFIKNIENLKENKPIINNIDNIYQKDIINNIINNNNQYNYFLYIIKLINSQTQYLSGNILCDIGELINPNKNKLSIKEDEYTQELEKYIKEYNITKEEVNLLIKELQSDQIKINELNQMILNCQQLIFKNSKQLLLEELTKIINFIQNLKELFINENQSKETILKIVSVKIFDNDLKLIFSYNGIISSLENQKTTLNKYCELSLKLLTAVQQNKEQYFTNIINDNNNNNNNNNNSEPSVILQKNDQNSNLYQTMINNIASFINKYNNLMNNINNYFKPNNNNIVNMNKEQKEELLKKQKEGLLENLEQYEKEIKNYKIEIEKC